jgi:hypothetical protein
MIKHLKPKSKEEIQEYVRNLPPQEKLNEGVKNNFIDLIKEALEEDPTLRKASGFSAIDNQLIWAIIYKFPEVIKILVEAGAKPHNSLSELGLSELNKVLKNDKKITKN